MYFEQCISSDHEPRPEYRTRVTVSRRMVASLKRWSLSPYRHYQALLTTALLLLLLLLLERPSSGHHGQTVNPRNIHGWLTFGGREVPAKRAKPQMASSRYTTAYRRTTMARRETRGPHWLLLLALKRPYLEWWWYHRFNRR
jgi:hypothetical protein